jgi:ubiquinone/menaquinone biosynthesis C-methylase UbiE
MLTPTREDWNQYWVTNRRSEAVYGIIADFYRKFIISATLGRTFRKYVPLNSLCLHAGAGSGEVDRILSPHWRLTGLDFSNEAVKQYKLRHTNPDSTVIQADNFMLPFSENKFDCIFNLGVMEHFTSSEIKEMLVEFRRVLKDDGVIILFWPPRYGLSVIVLRSFHWIITKFNPEFTPLHPREISLIESRRLTRQLVESAGFTRVSFKFAARDLFTHEVLVAYAN